MSEKITIPGLTARLSMRTGDTRKESEEFIKELFTLISSELEKGESVKVKGLGVFKTIDVGQRKSVDVTTGREMIIPAHRKVVFMPGKELASLVNEPFEMFKSVEIGEDETDSREDIDIQDEYEEAHDREIMESEEAPQSEYTESDVEENRSEYQESPEDEISGFKNGVETDNKSDYGDNISDDRDNSYDEGVNSSQEIAEDYPESEISVVTAGNTESGIDKETLRRKIRRNYWIGFGTGVVGSCLLALIIWNIIGIIQLDRQSREEKVARNATVGSKIEMQVGPEIDSDTIQTVVIDASTGEKSETQEEVAPTKPSDATEYDVISRTRYLTTMAKDHYGNYHLWPYIYKANEKFLGHPDRIKPGTKVVIPDLKQYGVNPSNPEDIRKAKEMGVKIYAKYKDR